MAALPVNAAPAQCPGISEIAGFLRQAQQRGIWWRSDGEIQKETDAERLDVFNGFLLSANLDALFDAGLVTFTNEGFHVSSDKLTQEHHAILGFAEYPPLRLRWIIPQHLPYLAWHRQFVFLD